MINNAIVHKHAPLEDKLIALLLAICTVLLLVATAPQIGLTWDEPTYIVAAETYPAWFGDLVTQPGFALSEQGVNTYWEFNHEHPPLSKLWSSIVWLGARKFFDDLTAHRLGNILLTSILIALLYLMLAREKNRTTGLVAAATLITMPRFFFHAHLSALDVPVTVMIFTVIYIFWLGRKRAGFRWTVLLGLTWGLSLATKINALIIPPIVLLIWVLVFRPQLYLFTRLALMGLIGAIAFLSSWPWLYYDTINRLVTYLGFFTTDRYLTEQFYFGHLYTPPPWHFPIIMTIIVVPFSLIMLATIGAISSMSRKEDRPLGGLFLLGAFISILVPGLGQIFDNERLLMPVFPFLAALAGLGFVEVLLIIRKLLTNWGILLAEKKLVSILVATTFVPHILLAYDLYPHLLSYYSEGVGGAYGAKALKLETTYWCESYSKTLQYLNHNTPHQAIIWAECQDVLIYYQLHGKLRSDLQIANGPHATTVFSEVQLNQATYREADYAVIQYRQSGFYRDLNEWIYARRPIFEYKYRRLRLAEVYQQ
jgi:4-amino-4-deoxy-L-arabinose transferase-like glycosyltransferase